MGDARGFGRSGQEDHGAGRPVRTSPPPGATSLGPRELRDVLQWGTVSARVDAIRRTRPAAGLEAVLVEALGDREGEVRLAAVEAIARWGGTRARRALVRTAASDPWPPVRARSIEALGDLLVRLAGEDEPETPTTAGRGA